MPARPTTFFPTDGLSSLSSSYRPRRSDLEIEKLSFQRGGNSDHPQSRKLRNYTIKGRQVFDLLHAGRETAVDTIRSKRRFVEIFKIDRARCQFLGNCRSTDELCQRAVFRAIRASNLFRIFLWKTSLIQEKIDFLLASIRNCKAYSIESSLLRNGYRLKIVPFDRGCSLIHTAHLFARAFPVPGHRFKKLFQLIVLLPDRVKLRLCFFPKKTNTPSLPFPGQGPINAGFSFILRRTFVYDKALQVARLAFA